MLTPGKIPTSLLAQLLHELPTTDAQLILGPAVGEDAAVIDFAAHHDRLLVAKSGGDAGEIAGDGHLGDEQDGVGQGRAHCRKKRNQTGGDDEQGGLHGSICKLICLQI